MNRNAAHSAALSRIAETLRARGAWCCRLRGGLGQAPGLPDLLAVLPPSGRLLAIEVKTGPRARPTAAQSACHEALREAGAVVLIGDLAAVLAELDRLLPPAQLRLEECVA